MSKKPAKQSIVVAIVGATGAVGEVLLRKLEEQAGLDPEVEPRVPTVVMAEEFLTFTL